VKVNGILVHGLREDVISRRMKGPSILPFKSKFEKTFSELYPQLEYEKDKIKYTVEHTYNPDWKIKENTYIETKGLWRSSDRAKMLHVKEQNPLITVYMVFQNPNNKLSRVSKTTYGMFCDKHGIQWATIDTIPEEWFK
jgi:hypothetical protein